MIDPRAGHGPGIGGFKIDSEIGIALKKGHPCYFVTFVPQPAPGQTIESVAAAEVAFLARSRAAPRGGGTALRDRQLPGGLGADDARRAGADAGRSDPAGRLPPVVLGGRRRKNPMRYMGGLLGGSWIASLLSDLGAGKFDGAYLVNNFER